jgi:hypothetical protein
MEIVAETLPWSSEDEQNWNGFLQTNTGRRLIPKLAEATPVLLDAGDINKILIRSGELRGFQISVRELLALTHSQPLPPNPTPAYPDLEDDTQWNDQQKIERPQKTK